MEIRVEESKEIRIPIDGWGFSTKEYGEILKETLFKFKKGIVYKASLQRAKCIKKDCSHEEPDIDGCLWYAKDLVLEEQ